MISFNDKQRNMFVFVGRQFFLDVLCRFKAQNENIGCFCFVLYFPECLYQNQLWKIEIAFPFMAEVKYMLFKA